MRAHGAVYAWKEAFKGTGGSASAVNGGGTVNTNISLTVTMYTP
jgi:hypothetical protein